LTVKLASHRGVEMQWFESIRTVTPEVTILVRLLLATAFGAVIGFEREYRARPAGLRTHMLTSLAASVFTIITFELFHEARSADRPGPADPIRIIEAVTAGVAFLAAGAIIQARGQVHGLTTGAAMWLAGAVGVACGAGYYTIAALATALSIVILTVLRYVEPQSDSNAADTPPTDNQRPSKHPLA
jgi:putative Mg2+ transporter-C (MgtC) family protein